MPTMLIGLHVMPTRAVMSSMMMPRRPRSCETALLFAGSRLWQHCTEPVLQVCVGGAEEVVLDGAGLAEATARRANTKMRTLYTKFIFDMIGFVFSSDSVRETKNVGVGLWGVGKRATTTRRTRREIPGE